MDNDLKAVVAMLKPQFGNLAEEVGKSRLTLNRALQATYENWKTHSITKDLGFIANALDHLHDWRLEEIIQTLVEETKDEVKLQHAKEALALVAKYHKQKKEMTNTFDQIRTLAKKTMCDEAHVARLVDQQVAEERAILSKPIPIRAAPPHA